MVAAARGNKQSAFRRSLPTHVVNIHGNRRYGKIYGVGCGGYTRAALEVRHKLRKSAYGKYCNTVSKRRLLCIRDRHVKLLKPLIACHARNVQYTRNRAHPSVERKLTQKNFILSFEFPHLLRC